MINNLAVNYNTTEDRSICRLNILFMNIVVVIYNGYFPLPSYLSGLLILGLVECIHRAIVSCRACNSVEHF